MREGLANAEELGWTSLRRTASQAVDEIARLVKQIHGLLTTGQPLLLGGHRHRDAPRGRVLEPAVPDRLQRGVREVSAAPRSFRAAACPPGPTRWHRAAPARRRSRRTPGVAVLAGTQVRQS